jgi:hypothetical protein
MQEKIIHGYVILHRHGHRAPIRNLFQSLSELNLWKDLLPHSLRLEELSQNFPVRYLSDPEERIIPSDILSKPFGCLTDIGMNYMIKMGQNVKKQFPFIGTGDTSMITMYSTNYHRTQVSGQSFLKGLNVPIGTIVQV